ncbi:MAG: hypothetical protein FWF50_04780 [Defluviitaleaceae bacterium]|nr:hypothetical protein [Defluviitaleaceae bacterium]
MSDDIGRQGLAFCLVVLCLKDEENIYILSVSCSEQEEFNIRKTMMEAMKSTKLLLTLIERVASKIAREKGITKVGWKFQQ